MTKTDSPGSMPSKELYIRLLGYVKPYRKIFALSILFTVIHALTDPVLAAMLKPLLDGSFIEKDPEIIRLMPLALIGVFLLRGVANYASTMAINWVATKVVMDLRISMFDKLLRLPKQYYDTHATGTILSKVTYNVEQVAAASTEVLIVLVRDSIAILGLLAWMLYLNWKLTLLIMLLGPVIAFIVNVISKRLRNLSHSIQDSVGDMTHVLEEAIQGHKVVKLFGGYRYEKERFAHISNWVRRYYMKRISAASISSPLGQFVMVLGLAGILYFASVQSMDDNISVGSFVSFVAAIAMMLAPLKKLVRINEQLQPGLAAASSIFKLLDELQETDTGIAEIPRPTGKIEFRNISFTYPEKQTRALNDISFVVQPGEKVALVGPSGGGKSTLVNMIPRFYTPSSGEILIDDQNIQEISVSELRRHIALVSQEITLFNDSVTANIAYGEMRSADSEAIQSAVKAAHAAEFINSMPEKLDTLIGENGAKISGGQKQRLAIARALIKDAPVLILDEATSALDTDSERYIQDALDTLTKDRTTLIIAHRLSTIENADRILVIAGGEIVESGDHKTLLKKNGTYRKLYENQLSS